MKAASINEIKNELAGLPAPKLAALCLQLAKFKKDNKELLTFLLFEAHDINAYTSQVKEEMDALFAQVNTSHLYFAKKTLRKILRITSKHIRYTASRQAEAELLIHFCSQMRASLSFASSAVLVNLYQSQLKKIHAAVASFHEDLQYDYLKDIQELS